MWPWSRRAEGPRNITDIRLARDAVPEALRAADDELRHAAEETVRLRRAGHITEEETRALAAPLLAAAKAITTAYDALAADDGPPIRTGHTPGAVHIIEEGSWPAWFVHPPQPHED